MTIHPINTNNIMLHVTPSDLIHFGIAPHELNQELAFYLAETAFRSIGITIQSQISLELYPDPFGALIFARLRTETVTWFTCHNVVDLCALLPPLTHSHRAPSITYFNHTYFLPVPSHQQDTIRVLTQFSPPLSTQPDFTLTANTPQLITFDPCILLDFPPF